MLSFEGALTIPGQYNKGRRRRRWDNLPSIHPSNVANASTLVSVETGKAAVGEEEEERGRE